MTSNQDEKSIFDYATNNIAPSMIERVDVKQDITPTFKPITEVTFTFDREKLKDYRLVAGGQQLANKIKDETTKRIIEALQLDIIDQCN